MYSVDVLIQGFPGKAVCHGGLGWSTVTLLRGQSRTILIDVGAFGVRRELRQQLKAHGVDPQDVTDVFLTHAHYDHAVNFVLFPQATVWIGERELAWASAQPPGFNPLPELYVAELARSGRVRRVQAGDRFLPGLQALEAPAKCGFVAHRAGGRKNVDVGHGGCSFQGLKCRTAASATALPCSCTKCPASGNSRGSGQPRI